VNLEEINKMLAENVEHKLNLNPNGTKFDMITKCPHCEKMTFMPVKMPNGSYAAMLVLAESTHGFERAQLRWLYKACQACGCMMPFLDKLVQ